VFAFSNNVVKIAYSDRFVLPLPEGHRFPMLKYELVKEQLLREGTVEENQLFDPGLCDLDTVLLTHDADYVARFQNLQLTDYEIRRIGFPMSELTVKRCFSTNQGTLSSALNALENGVGLNIAGGTHHAFRDKGEGFCMLNDIAVSANYLLNKQLAKQILVIDLDVHQGNGTAKIFENEPKVFTFSMHAADNYPLKKENSDLDIGLRNGTNDELYLRILGDNLELLINRVKPDFIFYQSGVDILETDKLGKLAVSRQGCKTRDEMVFESCKKHQIPLAVCMGGGYSERLTDIVEAHCNTFRLAMNYWG
jgi:acetoin utilization deacetylase AcuC-like enzyme